MKDMHHSSYTGKRALVIGAGVSGQAATRLLLALGANVAVIDEKPEAIQPAFMEFLRDKHVKIIGEKLRPQHFVGYDLVVTSPGVSYTRLAHLVAQSAGVPTISSTSASASVPHSGPSPIDAPKTRPVTTNSSPKTNASVSPIDAPKTRPDAASNDNLSSLPNDELSSRTEDAVAGKRVPEIMAETDLALQFTKAPVIAITGTSGKTTTVSLAAAMLKAAGKEVFLGGNIGTPLSELVLSDKHVDVIVLELSSFQLQGCKHLHAQVAVILNLNPNHLDQHTDMEEYTAAKFAIFNNQTASDLALVPPSLAKEYQRRGGKAPVQEISASRQFQLDHLQGEHNAMNAETAFLTTRPFGVSEAVARHAAKAFKPLAHRLEHAGNVKGVEYINDSKSTTVDSLRVALKSFEGPIILMAGGKFKGGDLQSLLPLMRDKVKAVSLYGGSREIFEKAWNGTVPLAWHETMDEAFDWARQRADANDVILLSPATSSYDQFLNYIERGKHFCRLVEGLQ